MTTTPLSYPLPTIHLNGTSRERLQCDYLMAYETLQLAYRHFLRIEFHARDYYIVSEDAYNRARTERDTMRAHFGALQKYLEAHLAHLAP